VLGLNGLDQVKGAEILNGKANMSIACFLFDASSIWRASAKDKLDDVKYFTEKQEMLLRRAPWVRPPVNPYAASPIFAGPAPESTFVPVPRAAVIR